MLLRALFIVQRRQTIFIQSTDKANIAFDYQKHELLVAAAGCCSCFCKVFGIMVFLCCAVADTV